MASVLIITSRTKTNPLRWLNSHGHDHIQVVIAVHRFDQGLPGALEAELHLFSAHGLEHIKQELGGIGCLLPGTLLFHTGLRSEEHTSELQSRENLVCRLLLEKKK